MAVAAVLVSTLIFVSAIPFAKMPLGPVPAFTPMYVASLVICDLITAVLLFSQFSFLRSASLLVLACAYSFTAAMTSAYVLFFPGLFSPTGLFGAGPQTTSAMYIFWHGGFPLAVIAYAVIKNREIVPSLNRPARSRWTTLVIAGSIAGVLILVVGYTILATVWNSYLPLFFDGNRRSFLGHVVLSGDGLLAFFALSVLWRRRSQTVIDLWLLVVMSVWLCHLGLAAILNTGRYDFGWYVGRIYGLLAASSLLVMLLIENVKHYARLVRMSEKLGESNDILAQLSLHDGLTGLANRRFFDTFLDTQLAVARRHRRALAMILCDVDAFKAFNDHYGHQAGDECLKGVAAALRSCCRRPADMAARYGGEEFALILPDTELVGATAVAEAIQAAISRLRIPHQFSPAGSYISISAGVAVLPVDASTIAGDMIATADRALFQAKTLGRNRVVSSQVRVVVGQPVRASELRDGAPSVAA